jgi:hypothetical protein
VGEQNPGTNDCIDPTIVNQNESDLHELHSEIHCAAPIQHDGDTIRHVADLDCSWAQSTEQAAQDKVDELVADTGAVAQDDKLHGAAEAAKAVAAGDSFRGVVEAAKAEVVDDNLHGAALTAVEVAHYGFRYHHGPDLHLALV